MYEMDLRIRSMPTEELLKMVREDADDYTEEALAIATDELTKRSIPWNTATQYGVDPDHCRQEEDQAGSANSLEQFRPLLAEELQYEESWQAVCDFVESMNIRNGEYEGARLVIRKMDRDNFILMTESFEGEARRITGCAAVQKPALVSWLERIGNENGHGNDDGTEDLFRFNI